MFQDMGFDIIDGTLRASAYVRPEQLDSAAAALATFSSYMLTVAVRYEVAAAITDYGRLVVTVNGQNRSECIVLADIAFRVLKGMAPAIDCASTDQTIIKDEIFTAISNQRYWVRAEFVYDGEYLPGEQRTTVVDDFLDRLKIAHRRAVINATTSAIAYAGAKAIIDENNRPHTEPQA